jgi:hypothetical protein
MAFKSSSARIVAARTSGFLSHTISVSVGIKTVLQSGGSLNKVEIIDNRTWAFDEPSPARILKVRDHGPPHLLATGTAIELGRGRASISQMVGFAALIPAIALTSSRDMSSNLCAARSNVKPRPAPSWRA